MDSIFGFDPIQGLGRGLDRLGDGIKSFDPIGGALLDGIADALGGDRHPHHHHHHPHRPARMPNAGVLGYTNTLQQGACCCTGGGFAFGGFAQRPTAGAFAFAMAEVAW